MALDLALVLIASILATLSQRYATYLRLDDRICHLFSNLT